MRFTSREPDAKAQWEEEEPLAPCPALSKGYRVSQQTRHLLKAGSAHWLGFTRHQYLLRAHGVAGRDSVRRMLPARSHLHPNRSPHVVRSRVC